MRTVKWRARTYHHGDLKAALLDAVEEIVREQGVGNVSLREVARRVGVTHAASAHHFSNKAGLLTAFATQGYMQLANDIVAAIAEAQPADGAATLEAVGRGYFRFAIANPGRFDVMFRLDVLNADDGDFIAASEGAYSLLVTTVAQCESEGFLHGKDPEVVAVAAWSLIHGLSALWISGRLGERIRERDPDRLVRNVSRLFVDAILREGRAAKPGPGRRRRANAVR